MEQFEFVCRSHPPVLEHVSYLQLKLMNVMREWEGKMRKSAAVCNARLDILGGNHESKLFNETLQTIGISYFVT